MTDELNQEIETTTAIDPAPETRRESMAALFDKVEAGESIAADRPRDEKGKFAPKADKATTEEPKVAAEPEPKPAAEPKPSLTTWRKEYLPIQEKLDQGIALTPDEAKKLAAYNIEREKQYSTGISTYKSEAAQAKQFTEAMAEFMPLLQQNSIQPAQWIQNLGRAHAQLALGSPEQKLQMFARLAKDYGVPVEAIGQAQSGQLDPVVVQLMSKIQQLEQGLTGVTSWRQQQEQQVLQQEVAKFSDATKYPHFEQVRESMIQLLESGVAQNPDEAYKKAVRLDETIQTPAPTPLPAPNVNRAAIGKAKAASGQVRTAAPRSPVSPGTAKDRRSALADAFAAADNGHI